MASQPITPFPLPVSRRAAIEQRIEELIAMLDFYDGDPDYEPDWDAEPEVDGCIEDMALFAYGDGLLNECPEIELPVHEVQH